VQSKGKKFQEAEEILLNSKATPLIFRLGTLFGLSDSFARLRVDLVLNVLTIRAILEGTMSVFGGQQFRPLLHVRDVATAAKMFAIEEVYEHIVKYLSNKNFKLISKYNLIKKNNKKIQADFLFKNNKIKYE
jgi:nucleoside-diphosphate-sugar epimerase